MTALKMTNANETTLDKTDQLSSPAGPNRASTKREIVLLRAILIAVAPIFALLTWQVDYSFTQMRHFSVPVMICEFAIVLLAFATRFDVRQAYKELNPVTRISAGVWLAVSAWASLVVAQPGQGANLLFITSCLQALFGFTLWWKLKTDWHGKAYDIMGALALGMALYVGIVLMLALSQADNPAFNWKLLSPGVSHDRQLGFYGLTLSGLAAGALAFARGGKCTSFWAILLVIGCWLTIWSGGRAGFGAMIGAIILIGALAPTSQRLRFAGLASLAVITAIALSYGFVPNERYGFDSILFRSVTVNEGLEGFTTGRTRMWNEALANIAQKPLFGHGEGQFRWIANSSLGRFNHPHSSPLQLLFQWGIVGTLAILVMTIPTLVKTAKSIRNLPRQVVMATGPLVGLVAMSLIDGAAYYVFPVMVMVLCLVIIASAPQRDSLSE